MTSKFYIKEVIDIDKKNEIISSKIQPNLKLCYWRNKIRKNKSVPDILRIK